VRAYIQQHVEPTPPDMGEPITEPIVEPEPEPVVEPEPIVHDPPIIEEPEVTVPDEEPMAEYVAEYGQCGGINFQGSQDCEPGCACVFSDHGAGHGCCPGYDSMR